MVHFREKDILLALQIVEYLLLLTNCVSVRVMKNLRGEWQRSL